MNILGISAYYHDSAAALLQAGRIVAAAQEERFTRAKHDAGFPLNAIEYCLRDANVKVHELDSIAFYDKPILKFERLLDTYLSYAPRGFQSFVAAVPVWLKEKLYLKKTLKKELASLLGCKESDLPPILFAEHHESHAASAFYPSPYEKAAVLCLDGVGEWATTSAWLGNGAELDPLWQIDFPHSLGLLYSAFTYYLGFKVNSGEYKLMGLAPYGRPSYVNRIFDNLIDVKDDGSFRLNLDYFDYCTGLRMTNQKFSDLFEGPPRDPESIPSQRDMDIAASIQVVTEEVVLKLARQLQRETGVDSLCMAGGVALNCVANGRLLREQVFKNIWIQPAAGDAGGALGAAYAAHHKFRKKERHRPVSSGADDMQGSLLGPRFAQDEVVRTLDELGATYEILDQASLSERVAELLANENVVGWFQNRMEFGPRALGARSILADPRSSAMQSQLNLKIKFRESFRPFAPAVKEEAVSQYFHLDVPSPYMLLVAQVHENIKSKPDQTLEGLAQLQQVRSSIPAVTHVDYSARVQTVNERSNPEFYQLLSAFEHLTGCPVLVNTSFNVRGEPIVCTPEDAYRCFMGTDMDYLAIGNVLLQKSEQRNAQAFQRKGALALD
ncbi:carbamoyltransferase family protein [Paenacidovorax monticola]|uniref:Carbamoyltransferase n=1 Tax=Paenacidovorax monticola TaxID=1926868 RepID=A0A7H0HBD9_9BURK|nr:carbamoyltransferase [Paenacidovorax monticola]QNP57855.1 carbamoyltransferase [Paenacidovorax monticola]